jgi:hypothetical protein
MSVAAVLCQVVRWSEGSPRLHQYGRVRSGGGAEVAPW